jgi:hypothetical protein
VVSSSTTVKQTYPCTTTAFISTTLALYIPSRLKFFFKKNAHYIHWLILKPIPLSRSRFTTMKLTFYIVG